MSISNRLDININILNLFKTRYVFLDKQWLDRQFHDIDNKAIKKPDELEDSMEDPPHDLNHNILNRIQGSMIGMALGDALGAHVEFRPKTYLIEHPVKDLQGGGTWGLKAGQVIFV
jgi:hypothetical protein